MTWEVFFILHLFIVGTSVISLNKRSSRYETNNSTKRRFYSLFID